MFDGVEVTTTDAVVNATLDVTVMLELEDSEVLELFDRGPVGSTETPPEAANVDDIRELLTDELTPRDVEELNHVLDAVLDMFVDVLLRKTVEGAPGNNAVLLVVSKDKELLLVEVFSAASVVVKDRKVVPEALAKLDEDDVLCEAVGVLEPPRFVVIVAGG